MRESQQFSIQTDYFMSQGMSLVESALFLHILTLKNSWVCKNLQDKRNYLCIESTTIKIKHREYITYCAKEKIEFNKKILLRWGISQRSVYELQTNYYLHLQFSKSKTYLQRSTIIKLLLPADSLV